MTTDTKLGPVRVHMTRGFWGSLMPSTAPTDGQHVAALIVPLDEHGNLICGDGRVLSFDNWRCVAAVVVLNDRGAHSALRAVRALLDAASGTP